MNRDDRNLSRYERESLILSPHQILKEFYARTQVHLFPDPAFETEIGQMACMVKCVVCHRIPLEIRQCASCEAVICKRCKHNLLEEQNK